MLVDGLFLHKPLKHFSLRIISSISWFDVEICDAQFGLNGRDIVITCMVTYRRSAISRVISASLSAFILSVGIAFPYPEITIWPDSHKLASSILGIFKLPNVDETIPVYLDASTGQAIVFSCSQF